ncbi:Proteasome inhibitor PI31 subunit [Blattella germanica]|nr:Proteasome inhibitor PI31 subunit [Blattella germanica]
MASNMYGWELTYKLAEKDIKKKEDVLVTLVHWYLIKHEFKCVGIGDSKTISDCDVETESLPEGWNANNTYTLRYIHNKQLYLLKGVKCEADIVINLLVCTYLSVSIIHFKVEDVVKNLRGDIGTLIPTYNAVVRTIDRDLVQPVVTGKNRETSTQTVQESTTERGPSTRYIDDEYDNPLRIGQPRGPAGPIDWDPLRDPFAVGRSDLDPLSRGGGGMIFNPFGQGGIRDPGAGIPGGLPRGSIPPGARFDPYGPPGVGPRRGGPGPSPDHLPPPGYDDMFM